jgi:hypothetical protein
MKDLAKKTGLKTGQVYKWNWDQKKKIADEKKIKNFYYPNEIFRVEDHSGKNITQTI